MAEPFMMPSWEEMASKIAHDFVDCVRRASAAEAEGNTAKAKEFRKAALRIKKLMDKYQITIRTSGSA
jgi:hypothetical protein